MNIKRRKIKTKYAKKYIKKYTKYNKKPHKGASKILKIIIYIVIFFVISLFLLTLFFYNKYLKDLPEVSELENMSWGEMSTIYDRNGKKMYNIFKEKRTYISYDEISKNMINAIVAGEDKRYWKNPGVDLIGLFRAGIYYVLGKSGSIGGTSTLTQQLIRNTIITNERSIERKLKEIFLAYQLTKKTSKEKILELYLNKVEFGHNSFGIEQAAETFFGIKAKNLDVLQASILASLPKGPSYYSPYNHPDRILGYLYEKIDNEEEKIKDKKLGDQFQKYLLNLKGRGVSKNNNRLVICGIKKEDFIVNYDIDEKGCSVFEYSHLMNFLANIKIKFGEKDIFYTPGRKDYILQRMLEDGYIDFNQYKNAISESIFYKFNQYKEKIEAAHFVFYIKEYLEKKYGKEAISMGGLKIYTTLDLDLQKKAEEIIKAQVKKNTTKFNAKNAALISIDNTNGDILSMVGGVDYFDQENDGNVNMITSKLQPGSSFKPFVYSLAILENEIGTKTPIYDLKTNFPSYSPANYDGKFLGKMNISSALNYSRNIPAVKMFYLAGGVKKIVDFLHSLGANSLTYKADYGASLALGTGEMTPLDLAKAYSVFANMGDKIEINPILKIVDSKGNIIEEKTENNIKKENVMSSGQAFILNSILSDNSTKPASRVSYLNISGRKSTAKTGTATKPVKKGGKWIQYPSNLWTIGYTPQITTVAWAGNTNGETLNYSGNGLEGASPIWKQFMEYAHKNKKKLKWVKPKGVKDIKISEITGYLPNPENIESDYLVSSYFINTPKKTDNSYQTFEVDALCNGVVTKDTPEAAKKNITILEFHSLKPDNSSWEEPVQKWVKDKSQIKYGKINSIGNINNKVCKRTINNSNIQIAYDLDENLIYKVGEIPFKIYYKSNTNIKQIEILVDGQVEKTINTFLRKSGVINTKLNIPEKYSNKSIKIEIRALDKQFYSSSQIKNINITSKSGEVIKEIKEIPKTKNENISIKIINPSDLSIKIYKNDYFNLRAELTGIEDIKFVGITLEGRRVKAIKIEENIVEAINSDIKLKLGINNVGLQVISKNGTKYEKNIKVEVLEK